MVGIGALASAGISSLFKIGAAIRQAKRAKQAGRDAKAMEAKGWNKYNTPEAFIEKEAMTRSQYNDPKMMGQRVMEDKLGANTANRISSIRRTAGSGAEAMLGLGLAQNNMNKGMQDIGLNATAQQMSDFNNFLNVLQQKSGYQDKEWEINKFNPYQQKLAEKQALEHSSKANLQNFASDIGNMGVIGSMMKGGQFGQKGAKEVPLPNPYAFKSQRNALMSSIPQGGSAMSFDQIDFSNLMYPQRPSDPYLPQYVPTPDEWQMMNR